MFGYLFLLCALLISPQAVFAQSRAPVQPCTGARCASKTPAETPSTGSRGRVSETLIDASIPDDPAVATLLGPYSSRVRALDIVIGKLEGGLTKGGLGGGTLGNFVADGIRIQASVKLGKPVLLAVTNSGGLRKNTIAEGQLRASDIFELLPFENALIEIDLTGKQLLKLLASVVAGRDAQSGARIKYRLNAGDKPEFVDAKLLGAMGNEKKVDPNATYTIVTIDYLLKLGSGSYSVLQEGENARPVGITLRDAIMAYVNAETAAGRVLRARLDRRFDPVNAGAAKSQGRSQ